MLATPLENPGPTTKPGALLHSRWIPRTHDLRPRTPRRPRHSRHRPFTCGGECQRTRALSREVPAGASLGTGMPAMAFRTTSRTRICICMCATGTARKRGGRGPMLLASLWSRLSSICRFSAQRQRRCLTATSPPSTHAPATLSPATPSARGLSSRLHAYGPKRRFITRRADAPAPADCAKEQPGDTGLDIHVIGDSRFSSGFCRPGSSQGASALPSGLPSGVEWHDPPRRPRLYTGDILFNDTICGIPGRSPPASRLQGRILEPSYLLHVKSWYHAIYSLARAQSGTFQGLSRNTLSNANHVQVVRSRHEKRFKTTPCEHNETQKNHSG